MSISIVISDTVKFKVKGSFKDGQGLDQPFDFSLTCKRLDADEIAARTSTPDTTFAEVLGTVIQDWHGVTGQDSKPVPYSADALKALCKLPGVAFLVYQTYMSEVGAKAKN